MRLTCQAKGIQTNDFGIHIVTPYADRYKTLQTDGLTALIDNVYTKLNYVQSGFNTEDEIVTALTRDSIVKNLQDEYPNAPAHTEMLSWLSDEARSHRRVSIRSLTDKFLKRPFGWSEFDTLGVLAELVNLGKVELRKAQATVNPKESGLVVKLRSRSGLDEYLVRLCNEVDPASLRVARDLAGDLLEGTPPSDPTAQIPQLAQLLQPVQALVREQLQAQSDRVAATGVRVREKVGQYAIDAHPDVAAQLDLAQLTQPIDRVTIALEQAQTIDSAIAREIKLERLERQLLEQIDTAAATLSAQQTPTGGEAIVAKPMVTVRLSQVAGKSIFESSQDVDDYLERVRMAIVAEIEQGKRAD